MTTESIHLHPRKWPIAIPLVVAAVMFIFISPQKNDYSVVIACSFLVLIAIVMLILFSASEIRIENSGLAHKTILGTKEMLWQDIARTYIKYRHHGKSGSYYWFFEDANAKKIKFSTRLYSRKNLQQLAEILYSKRKEAIDDERLVLMAEGRFPWYIF